MTIRTVHKRYFREMLLALLVYVLLIFLSASWLKTLEGTAARAVVTLLPVIPVGFLIQAMVRVIRGQDELERRIDLESIAIGGAIAGFGFFTYGMLLNARVLAQPQAETVAIWVFPVLMFCFGVVKCCMRLYYRER